MSSIAEAFERSGLAEFHQFLSTAKASAVELRSPLHLAKEGTAEKDMTQDSGLVIFPKGEFKTP